MINMNSMSELMKGKHFYGAVSVGERGQVVIPKEARKQFGIRTGDKLIVMGTAGGRLVFLKADILKKFAEKILGTL